MKTARCEYIKADGNQCGQRVSEGNRYCIWHSPTRKKEAAAARSRGGQAAGRNKRKTPPADELPSGPPETAAEAQQWASWLTWATASGKIDPNTSQRVSTSLRVFLTALEKAEMEQEIARLQAQVKELQRAK
jgi:hypothetical protein